MNRVYRIPLILLLAIQALVTISCSNTDSANSPPEPVASPDPGVAPGDSPGVGNESPGAGGVSQDPMSNDRREGISKDLADTVETVKSRNVSTPRRGVFFSLGVSELERSPESGDEQSGSDSDITSIALGYDQVISDTWVLGTVLDLSKRDVSPSSQIQEFSQSSDSISVLLFSNLALDESTDLAGYAGLGRADVASKRITQAGRVLIQDQNSNTPQTLQVESGEALGKSNSNIVSAGLFVTRRKEFGSGNQLILSAEADFSRITTNAFSERGTTNTELAFQKNSKISRTFTLSAGLSKAYSTSFGVLVPTFTLAYIRENIDDDPILADFVSNPTLSTAIEAAPNDSSYGKVDLDLVWVRPRGIQLFGNITANFANDFEDSAGINIGARLEF